MTEPLELVLVALGVFALNLLPAFGPPTGGVLVALSLSTDVPSVPLVICGALAAASGRYVLARLSRRLGAHLSEERRANLAAAERLALSHRGSTAAGLGLFALSPVPSGQLFVAAGLMTVPLVPLTAAFFTGRLVSYSLYVTGAGVVGASVGDSLTSSLTSPLGIALQVAALLGLGLLVRVDWAAFLPAGAPVSREGTPGSGGRPSPAGP